MLSRLKALWRVTAIRLSVAYTIAFGLLAIFLVVYMTGGAVDYLRQQYQTSINEEVEALQKVYELKGLNGVVDAMELRSRTPGANLYVVSSPEGQILAGNVRSLNPAIMSKSGWVFRPFPYEKFSDNPKNRPSQAVARTFVLPNGIRVLIGQDIGEPQRFQTVVRRALTISLGMMLLLGFFIWYFVGRRALKRIDLVSKSTERILGGDRSERLPVTGGNDEFDRLSQRMNQMLDRISLLDGGLKNVSDSIAHDLKTPLTRIRNKADSVLSTSKGSEAVSQALSEIIAESDQLIKTFNALLMISRVEAGSQVAETHIIDLSELLSDLAELYEPLAEDENVTIETEIAPSIKIDGNRELLSQAFSNLLENALKYGRAADEVGNRIQPKIRISLSQHADRVTALIADNGPGIPDHLKEKAKERFVRFDESRSKPGNGLGLALVEAISTFHNGVFTLAEANPGLAAQIELPVSQPIGPAKKKLFLRKGSDL